MFTFGIAVIFFMVITSLTLSLGSDCSFDLFSSTDELCVPHTAALLEVDQGSPADHGGQ